MPKTLFQPVTEKVYERTHKLATALQEDFNGRYPNINGGKVFDIVEGRKYNKIVMVDNQESVHAFVDRKTGDVFKPASWRGPAKIARYNLLDDASYGKCLANADWAGGYLYLR